jgi:primosomal protein N'
MKIKSIISQHRRDFWAIYVCEHCGYETEEESGYDDMNFHQNVIPKMKCKNCGETSGNDYHPRATKYPGGLQL